MMLINAKTVNKKKLRPKLIKNRKKVGKNGKFNKNKTRINQITRLID